MSMPLIADDEATAAHLAGMKTDCSSSSSRGDSILGSRTPSEMKAVRSHSEAERRRRQRINGHLATLRSLLPAATRMDKAALLGEVVRRVRELKGKVGEADVAVGVVPSEGDEVGVEEVDVEDEDEEETPAASEGGGGRRRKRRLRAWVSCPDRAGLMGELSRAVRSVRGRVVRVEMVTVGGRTRSLLELEMTNTRGGGEARPALQAALLAVLLPDRSGPGDGFKRSRLSSRFTCN